MRYDFAGTLSTGGQRLHLEDFCNIGEYERRIIGSSLVRAEVSVLGVVAWHGSGLTEQTLVFGKSISGYLQVTWGSLFWGILALSFC